VSVGISEEFEGTQRFRVLRRIGAGGMGVVYEAEDRERGQRVALKTLKRADSDTFYRLKREFRALADLQHPNLVALFELVVAEHSFFTMELLSGCDLLSYVRRSTAPLPEHAPTVSQEDVHVDTDPEKDTLEMPSPPLSCDEARLRAVLPQVVQGLMALHAAGKIHRDVKPSNVLVTDDERAVLVDFGLVTHADPLVPESFDGHIAGTVSYMAPEQCRGELRLTPATDFYAVGVMLYEALTGRLPFEGGPTQILVEKQQHVPPPPHTVNAGVPADLDELCVELLKREPEDRPSGTELLRRLGVETPPHRSSSQNTRAAPFAGRQAEMAQLEAALEVMVRGQPAVILVRGPSGIGKSALCQRFLDSARARHAGLVALHGRCYERETVPYQAMDSLIDHLSQFWIGLPTKDAVALLPREAGLLSRLFPVLGRVPCVAEAPRPREGQSPLKQRTRAFAALRELLQRLGERRELALCLDDMQWVDANTLAVLADLMRPPDPPRLLLLLSTRPEGSGALEAMVRRMDTRAETIDLAPLSVEASSELARGLFGGSRAVLADEVAREAGGNPFFIGELVQYLQTSERASLGALRLEDVIAQRISQLSETGRRLLQLVALAGEPISRRELTSALGVPAADLVAEAGVLRTLHFVRSAGALTEERIEPYHARVRDAALASLDEEGRRARHRELAIACEREAAAAEEQLARHWQGAGEEARAAEHARKAAEQSLARLDFDRAAGLYRLALKLGQPSDDARRALQTALGDALAMAGRPLDAAQALQAATDGAEPATRTQLQRRSAEELLRGGYLEEGLAAIHAVLADFGLRLARTPLRALASIAARRLWLRLRGLGWRQRSVSEIRPTELAELDALDSVAQGLGFVDPIRGFDFQVRALLSALRLGESDRLARALAREVAYLGGLGQIARARKVLDVADRAAAQTKGPYAAALVALGRGIMLYYSGDRWREARDQLAAAEQLFLAQGRAGWEIDTAQLHRAFALLQLGELAELSRQVPGWIREAERRGDQYASVTFRVRLPIVWLARDEVARAEEDVEGAISSWRPMEKGFNTQHYWAMLGRGDVALYSGQLQAGADKLAVSLPGIERSKLFRLPIVRVLTGHLAGRLALARAVASPDETARRALLSEARTWASQLARDSIPVGGLLAQLLFATLAHLEGRPEDAILRLRQVTHALEASDTRLHAAAVRRRLGEALGGDEGRALIAQADVWYAAQSVKNPARMTAMLLPGWNLDG
jgi:hypothetical protein